MTSQSQFAAEPEKPNSANSKSNANTSALATSGNQFAVDLYGKLNREKGNLLFSPSSISTALDMTYAGARGNTAEQMSKVLHLNSLGTAEHDTLHAAAGKLIDELNAAGKQGAYQLTVANRIWGQQGYKFLDAFLAVLRT